MLTGEQRRNEILKMLTEADTSITAQRLADKFGLSRQVIVSDIGILRAKGHTIVAAKSGYCIMTHNDSMLTESIVCRHNADQTMDEFRAVLDEGGIILDVIVEHPIYGEIEADLGIRNAADAEAFVRKAKACSASQLSDLTGGLHIHTIKVPDPEAYSRITSRLKELGILI